MWYVTHQYHYEDKMFTNAELKEKYNIDGDSVSLSYYSDMKLFEKYDVKEEQYSDKSKFISYFNSVYSGKTNKYVYLIIGIILIVVAVILKSKKIDTK